MAAPTRRDGIGTSPGDRFGLPPDLDGGHGIGDALELELADRRELVGAVPTDHRLEQLGGEDLPARAPCRTVARPRRRSRRSSRPTSSTASPIETPTRSSRRSSPRRLWRSTPCWIAAAHDNARLGPVNISMTPSPVVFTSIPPVASAAPRRIAKWAWRSASVASGPRRDANAVDPTRSVNRKVAVIGVLIVAPERCKTLGDRPARCALSTVSALCRQVTTQPRESGPVERPGLHAKL